MRVLLLAPVVLLAMAGCLEGEAPPEAGDPAAEAPAVDPLAWSGTECNGRGDFIGVDKAWADAQAAPYTSTTFDAVRGFLVMFTVECQTVTIGEDSVGPDRITLVAIGLGFDTPGPFGPATVRTSVLWAYHETGATALARLVADAGIPVVPAQVEIASWDGGMTITAEGQSVEVVPTVPNRGSVNQMEGDTWLLLREGSGGSLAWTWNIPTGYESTETYLHATTLLGGAPYAGACSPAEAMPGPCHRSNTDDYIGFDIVGATATPEEAASG